MTPNQTANQNYNRLLKGVALLFVIALVFVGGIFAGTKPAIAEFIHLKTHQPDVSHDPDTTQNLTQFWYVWNLIQEKYPFKDKIPTGQDKVYGAIEGMVASYKDPYTVFFAPQQAKLFNDQVKGSFGGVGMEMGLKKGFITVIAPLKDSPAEHAGIKAGDIVTEINGKKTDSMDIDTAISLIRGNVGTDVTLTVARVGETEFKKITITRAIVKVPVVDTLEKGNVFIISLYSFSEDSAQLFTNALVKFSESGKTKLIIDLRNNPGGYLEAAVDIASYFLPRGTTVVKENSGTQESETQHESKGYTLLRTNPKMVVLINGGSASASEILAGALMDHHVATIIGETSFGKGSVQQVIDLDDGSALKVTIAKWFTPKGTSISDKGITPDVVVEEKPLLDKKTNTYSDPELEKAIQVLSK